MNTPCPYDPSTAENAPLGMYHCPLCGNMVVSGVAHPDYSLIDDVDFLDPLTYEVIETFNALGRVWPTTQDALLFIHTEVSEAAELDLARRPYLRNHVKEPYTPERYAEELGDAIYMAIIAGRVEGVDAVQAMRDKMARHLARLEQKDA